MKRGAEWLRLEIAFLLWVIISTDSLPSHPRPTSLPGLCHSHPFSPLHFSVCVPCNPAERHHLFWLLCDKQKNESDWKCKIINKLKCLSVWGETSLLSHCHLHREKSERSNFLSVTHKKCSLDTYDKWRTQCAAQLNSSRQFSWRTTIKTIFLTVLLELSNH